MDRARASSSNIKASTEAKIKASTEVIIEGVKGRREGENGEEGEAPPWCLGVWVFLEKGEERTEDFRKVSKV